MKRRSFLKLLAGAVFAIPAVTVGGIAMARSVNRYYSGPATDHFDGTVFFNPDGEAPKGLVELLKWQLGGGRKSWPDEFPSPYSAKPEERIDGDEMVVTFVGHATVLVQTAGLNLLMDPVWSRRASPFQWAGPARVNDPGIAFADLPPIDAVLLSHNHYDHLDLETLSRLKTHSNPLIVTPLGNDTILHDQDPDLRVSVGDWGDSVALTDDVSVTFEPAHHWSARGLGDRRHALWAAFVINTPGGRIYHVGDTGFHRGINYREVQKKYGSFRLAILPFGAYEPRGFMRAQHQNPDEAVQAHLLCEAAYTLGHHWGTFQLTNESIEDQLTDLTAALDKHGVSPDVFRALRPGEAWSVPESATGSPTRA